MLAEASVDPRQVNSRSGPTYMYQFEWERPVLPHLGAAHGIDGSFYFNNTEGLEITRGIVGAQTLAGQASTAWANFAKTGQPATKRSCRMAVGYSRNPRNDDPDGYAAG